MYPVSFIDLQQLSSKDPLSYELGIHRLDCKTLLLSPMNYRVNKNETHQKKQPHCIINAKQQL